MKISAKTAMRTIKGKLIQSTFYDARVSFKLRVFQ